ncbi:MAG: lipid A biosynthesis acyltransferase [Limnohabitans sp.]|jgi:KDO2-lipid IV(A) lauroyltransferase
MISLLIACMRWMAAWPLSWIRALGWVLGWALWCFARSRRHIVLTNLRLCMPDLGDAERQNLARQHFLLVGQSLLDRAWLWHAPEAVVRSRLHWRGATHMLDETQPLVLFAPHFVGLDAGGSAVALEAKQPVAFIYVTQSDPQLEAWVRQGRERWGHAKPYFRHEGIRKIIVGLKRGERLHLSPDMDLGREESIFVPFMGVQAATVPSLSRMAKMVGAKVVPVVTRLTHQGYDIEVGESWVDFPGGDIEADTRRMNEWLGQCIRTMPAQYYWVHKRFKTRPEGEPGVY